MKKITKARLSLVALIALLNVGLVLLWQNWHPQKYVGWGADASMVENVAFKVYTVASIVMVFIIPAIILLWATFFTLNEKGQVPRGSWLYKVIELFAPCKEVEIDGKKTHVKDIPEEVRFCPTFYKLVGAAFSIYAILGLLYGWLFFIPREIYTELTDDSPVNFSWPDAEALGMALLGTLALFAGIAVLVGLWYLLVKIWPRLRDSVIGQIIAAVYDKACVPLKIEPQTETN